MPRLYAGDSFEAAKWVAPVIIVVSVIIYDCTDLLEWQGEE